MGRSSDTCQGFRWSSLRRHGERQGLPGRGLHRVIRPILYVNLPAVVYALDRRARSRRGEFAHFVCAPDAEEPRSAAASLAHALVLINPTALTWVCEDRWRLLGVAQASRRGRMAAWDLRYLAAIMPQEGQDGVDSAPQDEVLLELLQFALDTAIMRGVQRVFASVEDETHDLELFARAGFQRYARELRYWLPRNPTHADLDALEQNEQQEPHGLSDLIANEGAAGSAGSAGSARDQLAVRHWHRHDDWGLLRLYDASTPRRVQAAECLNAEEFIETRAAGGRMWSLPLVEPSVQTFVYDRGVRLGGWLRLRRGRGSQPHQLWLMAHPEDAGMAGPLLRFGLRQLAAAQPRPVLCQVREYDGAVVDALRSVGFEHTATRALLVRHLVLRALRTVPAIETRVAYGVKGLGAAQSRMDKGGRTLYATHDH